MGFVEKKLESGEYMAVPLKEVAPILVKQRRQEISKLETEIKTLVDCIPQKKSGLEIKHEILMTLNKNRTLNRVQKYFEEAKSQIELMQTWKRFLQFWQYYETTLECAMERGVIIKQIVELPKDENQAREFLEKKVFQNCLFELRFVCKAGGNYTIVDNHILLLSTSQRYQNLGEMPFIFTNYEGLLGLMQGYFQLSWKTAIVNKMKVLPSLS